VFSFILFQLASPSTAFETAGHTDLRAPLPSAALVTSPLEPKTTHSMTHKSLVRSCEARQAAAARAPRCGDHRTTARVYCCSSPTTTTSRRAALLATGASGLLLLAPPPPPAAATAAALCAALDAPTANPGVAWAVGNRNKQLRYPPWMQGTWGVRARFLSASFPLGKRFLSKAVPGALKASLAVVLPDVGAGMDGEVLYRQRFLISDQQGGVVADRAFNVQQIMDAYLGYEAVKAVNYDPLDNPTRMVRGRNRLVLCSLRG